MSGDGKMSRDAIEHTARDLRDSAMKAGKKDPGHDGANKTIREIVIKQETRRERDNKK